MTRKRRRLWLLLACGVGLGSATALGLSALGDNLVFFVSPSDLVARAAAPGRTVRLGGLVEAGSVVRDGDQVSTVYANPVDGAHDVPANASLGCSRSGVVVISRGHDLDGRDVLVVDETLTKDCAPYDQLPDAVHVE